MNEIDMEAEPKLCGLPRHFVGAIFGLLLFFLIAVPLYRFQYTYPQITPLKIFFAGLVFPGAAVWFMIEMSIETSTSMLFLSLLAFGFSSLPASLVGSCLISTKKTTRSIGFALLAFYMLFIFGCGSMFYGDFG